MAAITSAASGVWSDTDTWTGGAVPGENDTATIDAAHTVTVDQDITIGVDSGNALTIRGVLDVPYNIAASYSLTLKGNIAFGSGGQFKIGSSSNRLASDKTFSIILGYSATLAGNKYPFSTSTGKILWYGVSKTCETTLLGNVTAGTDPTITVAEATNWRVGDIIVLVDETNKTKTEELTIKAGYTSGTSVTLSGTLANNKTSGWIVLNMSSNIIVKNYDDTKNSYFNLEGSSHILSYVMFNKMGYNYEFPGIRIRTNALDNSASNVIFDYNGRQACSYYGNETILYSYNNRSDGIVIPSDTQFKTAVIIKADNCIKNSSNQSYHIFDTLKMFSASNGITDNYDIYSGRFTIGNCVIRGCSGTGIVARFSEEFEIGSLDCRNVGGSAVYCNGSNIYINDFYGSSNGKDIECNVGLTYIRGTCTLSSITTPVSFGAKGRLFVTNYNGTSGYNRQFNGSNVILESDTSVYNTDAPSAKVYVNTTYKLPMLLSGYTPSIYVNDNKNITISGYSRKDATSTGQIAKLRVATMSPKHGLSSSEYSILPSSNNAFESFSIDLGTTTSAGFVTLELVVTKGGTTWNLWIDDLTITES